ncbi:CAP domain-containing protein [Pedobacter jejuensis]|uniref:CAP domain-containing protein n=1 Tax=Pedobacter jejuensis TaxID=1268550 RepID=A0A3N0BRV2_9SPHI|nr:CAP domain-containing protein [Pedobacter jejuensis]RNL51709.1 CAP domain-containing protein [Pedobacter jejuensis]
MKFASLILLFLVISVTSCKKNDLSVTTNNEKPLNTGLVVNTNLNNDLFLKLVNDVRKAGCNCGSSIMPAVAPLAWNNLLAAAALAHSKDMNANNYFSHTSLDGKNAGMRITAAGYQWTTYGENIAAGQPNEQAVFDAWITSEGHCKNIMNANFKEMAVAKDGRYWTQEFAAK